jgi:hypothetical protein
MDIKLLIIIIFLALGIIFNALSVGDVKDRLNKVELLNKTED